MDDGVVDVPVAVDEPAPESPDAVEQVPLVLVDDASLVKEVREGFLVGGDTQVPVLDHERAGVEDRLDGVLEVLVDAVLDDPEVLELLPGARSVLPDGLEVGLGPGELLEGPVGQAITIRYRGA